ncbi:MAG: SprB repeat-containing protein, partial [Flavobacteriales bacterium]
TVSATPTNVTCFGLSNGAVSAASGGGTAPYSYTWSPAGTGSSLTGLGAGSYSVTITDANGCTNSASTTITQPSQITAAITSTTDVSCFGGNNGAASLSASGGSGNLTYTWAPSGGSTTNASGLTSGNYTITVTDPNGCSTTVPVTINQPAQLLSSISGVSNPLCNGAATGTATVNPAGGIQPYSFNWSPSGGTAATASALNAT